MTPHEIELARALWACRYVPGTSQKRFARSMAEIAEHSPDKEVTLRQRHYMELLAWRMRRQMPRHLVPDSKPLNLPPQRRPYSKKKPEPPKSPEQLSLL